METMLAHDVQLSSRKRRIAAFLIDHFTFTFLMVSIIFLLIGPDFIDEEDMSRMTNIMWAVMVPGFLIYFAKESIRGISPGKWIMGIMVRDANDPDQVPPFFRIMLRNLFLIIWPVEFIVLASSADKKRIGDRTARTIVVKNPDKPAKLPRILSLVLVGALFFAFARLFAGNAMKSSEAYKTAIEEIERNEEILSETGGIKDYGMMPGGSINISNGRGEAQLDIKVIGNKQDVQVSVYLTKEVHGEWEVKEVSK